MLPGQVPQAPAAPSGALPVPGPSALSSLISSEGTEKAQPAGTGVVAACAFLPVRSGGGELGKWTESPAAACGAERAAERRAPSPLPWVPVPTCTRPVRSGPRWPCGQWAGPLPKAPVISPRFLPWSRCQSLLHSRERFSGDAEVGRAALFPLQQQEVALSAAGLSCRKGCGEHEGRGLGKRDRRGGPPLAGASGEASPGGEPR